MSPIGYAALITTPNRVRLSSFGSGAISTDVTNTAEPVAMIVPSRTLPRLSGPRCSRSMTSSPATITTYDGR